MPISSGSEFASYVVAESIGFGGMGEVYRAQDTTLECDVVIKVLPKSFATDANRIARIHMCLHSVVHGNWVSESALLNRKQT
jgi:serine/threonine protein kinase